MTLDERLLSERGIRVLTWKEGDEVALITDTKVCDKCGGKGRIYTYTKNSPVYPDEPSITVGSGDTCHDCDATGRINIGNPTWAHISELTKMLNITEEGFDGTDLQ